MTRLTRPRLGAALAVVLALAPTARAAEPEPLIPAESDSVLFVNVKQIIGSDIVKKYALEQLKQALQGNDAQKALGELGLDPLKDIDTITVGASGKDQTDMSYLAVVRGKFDPEKLNKAAEAQAKKDADHFTRVKEGAATMYKYQSDNGQPLYAAVLNDTTVLAGSDKKVVAAALAGGTAKSAVSKDLSALVGRMDPKSSLWLVSVVKGKLDNVKLPAGGPNPMLQAQLGNMETMTAVVNVTTDVTLDITLGMKNADAADEMGKAVKEGLETVRGILPFLAAQKPELKPLVEAGKSLKSDVKDKAVVVTAKLPGTAIGALLKQGGD